MHHRLPLHPRSPLKPTPKDKRDFKLGNVFDLPKITEIPLTDWIVSSPLGIKNQARIEYNNDECTAYATSEAAEAHEGIEIDPNYTFAKEKMLLGDWQSFGGDLRTAMKAGVEFGFLPISKSPFVDRPRDFVANWHNWPTEYDAWAAPQKQQSYFSCEGPYDLFDNIRASLWHFKDKKNLVVVGSYWYPAWSFPAIIPDTRQTTQPSGHAFLTIGQKMIGGVPYLVVQQSYGSSAGDNGLQYFSRTVVNREWKDFGAFMFVDMSPDSAKELNRIDIITRLINLWKQLLYIVKSNPAPVPPAPTPTPLEPQHTSKIAAWAKAIQHQEGGKPGDLNMILNNPGNVKYSTLTAGWGGTKGRQATDGGWLCQFPTYDKGFQALCNFLTLGAQNKLLSFHQARTLLAFTKVYAHPPNDNYAIGVAQALNVKVGTDISTFL